MSQRIVQEATYDEMKLWVERVLIEEIMAGKVESAATRIIMMVSNWAVEMERKRLQEKK